jgi:hypothetical protein
MHSFFIDVSGFDISLSRAIVIIGYRQYHRGALPRGEIRPAKGYFVPLT